MFLVVEVRFLPSPSYFCLPSLSSGFVRKNACCTPYMSFSSGKKNRYLLRVAGTPSLSPPKCRAKKILGPLHGQNADYKKVLHSWFSSCNEFTLGTYWKVIPLAGNSFSIDFLNRRSLFWKFHCEPLTGTLLSSVSTHLSLLERSKWLLFGRLSHATRKISLRHIEIWCAFSLETCARNLSRIALKHATGPDSLRIPLPPVRGEGRPMSDAH